MLSAFTLGYPPRPDATAWPDRYAKWLDRVSRPVTFRTGGDSKWDSVFSRDIPHATTHPEPSHARCRKLTKHVTAGAETIGASPAVTNWLQSF